MPAQPPPRVVDAARSRSSTVVRGGVLPWFLLLAAVAVVIVAVLLGAVRQQQRLQQRPSDDDGRRSATLHSVNGGDDASGGEQPSKLAPPVTPKELLPLTEHDEDVDELYRFVEASGGHVARDAVSVRRGPYGLGLFARRRIATGSGEGEVIFNVMNKTWIAAMHPMLSPVARSCVSRVLHERIASFDSFDILAVAIAAEVAHMERGGVSHWGPYLRWLRKTQGSTWVAAFHATPVEQRLLQTAHAVDLMADAASQASIMHRILGLVNAETEFDREHFKWARTMAASRSYSMRARHIGVDRVTATGIAGYALADNDEQWDETLMATMLPLLDILNHRSDAHNQYFTMVSNDGVTMLAPLNQPQPLEAGVEMFNTYHAPGDLRESSATNLLAYGFVEPPELAPNDAVRLLVNDEQCCVRLSSSVDAAPLPPYVPDAAVVITERIAAIDAALGPLSDTIVPQIREYVQRVRDLLGHTLQLIDADRRAVAAGTTTQRDRTSSFDCTCPSFALSTVQVRTELVVD